MSFVRIWIHAVWGTKNREPILRGEFRSVLFDHIKENAKKKEIYIREINGYLEHVHCLIGLGAEQTTSKVIQLIKGESSYWANKNNLIGRKFEWADEYFAVSVSESQLQSVIDYIRDQQEHHRKKSYAEEYDEFIKKYGFAIMAKAK